MFQQITLPRTFQNVLATSNETGIYIVAGWTMAIPKKDAIAYVKSYNTHPNVGFYQHNGQVILTHRDGRLDLSPQEANAIIDLIKAAYGPF